MPSHISYADYCVIAFYFIFMSLISWVMKRFIRNTSDYFRAGGEILWWMAGAGAFTVSFSAVTFTGMAGKAYLDGPVVLVIFIGNALGFLVNFLWFAPISRQTRAVTAMQVVRNRFGRASEQLFTWVQIPSGLLYAGLWLTGLAVFVSAAFNIPLAGTITVTGSVVIVMALLGGSWSVMAGDFVQLLVLMPISAVAAFLALRAVGGPSQFLQKLPSNFYHWGEAGSTNIIGLWVVTTLVQKFVSTNSMQDCSRYLSVKDSKHARKAALLGMILYVVGPILWFIPPMAARIAYPHIGGMFPNLTKNPQEAAFFAIAVNTMPAGMVGLLLSAIFGATMSAMDGGLNKNAGFFVKNFYQVYVRPDASERRLLIAGKISTFVLGALIILTALLLASWKETNIFDQMTSLSALIGLPIAIPLVLGLFVKKAPGWAGWSTVLVTLTASILTYLFLDSKWLGHVAGFALNKRETSDWRFISGTAVNSFVGCAWFLGSCLFYKRQPAAERARIGEFFAVLQTPVDFAKEEGAGSDNLQAKIMGLLCMIYGAFILLLTTIPNSFGGRMCFVFCGGIMGGIGLALYLVGTRGSRVAGEAADALPGGSVASPRGDAMAEPAVARQA